MGLEIEHDPAYHRREYRFQVAGRVLMALLLLAAAIGLLGPGLISRTTVRADGGLAVTFERTLRIGAPTRIVVEADRSLVADGHLELRISRSLLDHMRVEGVTPAPVEEQSAEGEVRFVLPAGSGDPLIVGFDLTPETSGWAHGQVVAADGPAAGVRQLIFP